MLTPFKRAMLLQFFRELHFIEAPELIALVIPDHALQFFRELHFIEAFANTSFAKKSPCCSSFESCTSLRRIERRIPTVGRVVAVLSRAALH